MPSKRDRKFKNYLLNPQMQLRITIYFMVLGLAIWGFMLALLHNQTQEVQSILANTSEVAIATQKEVAGILGDILKVASAFFLISLIGAFVYGVIVSHRIAGPMFAATQLIKELRNGNYKARRQIRPYDELSPVIDELNQLAGDLEKKHPSS